MARNQSQITESLSVDDPLIQGARFSFDTDDRQYLDNQIRGVQRHLVDALIRGRHATYLRSGGAAPALLPGHVVCIANLDEGEPKLTKATTSTLADAKAACGVAVVGAAPGSFVLFAHGGVLPSTITKLPKNNPGFVRVNGTTGFCERVATLGGGDYGIGVLARSGDMLVVPGISSGGAATPSGNPGDFVILDETGTALATTPQINYDSVNGHTDFIPISPVGTCRARSAWPAAQTTNASQHVLAQISFPAADFGNDGVLTVHVQGSYAYATGGGKFVMEASFKRVSGTLTRIGFQDLTISALNYGAALGGIDIDVLDNDTVEAFVTGIAATTISYQSSLHVQWAQTT